jgi:hypothetical protein
MRGYIRPLGYAIPYASPRNPPSGFGPFRRFNHPFMQGLPFLDAGNPNVAWAGQGARTDIVVLATADITNGHTITLVDGMGKSVTFEFRTAGPVTPPNVLVDISAAVTADDVRDAFTTEINNQDAGGDPLRLTATATIAATVTALADYNTSRGNFPVEVGAFTGGLVSAQAASANRFTVDDSTMLWGYEGPLAVPARMGFQRMMPTQIFPIPTQGVPNNEE